MNQVNVLGTRQAGRSIAEQIASYHQQSPGRPVYLIGHSGGAGVALFALEALGKMPNALQVTGVVLLGPRVREFSADRAVSGAGGG